MFCCQVFFSYLSAVCSYLDRGLQGREEGVLLDILVLGQDLDQPPPFADGLAEMGTKTHVTNLAIIYL